MTKFMMDPKLLAYMLDLPEDAKLGVINRIPRGGNEFVYEVNVDCPGWPEGVVELVYTQLEDGTTALTGYNSA